MKERNTLFLSTLSGLILSSHAELVPGGDFEVYKPGTNYTVKATFASGNSFARGVGDGIELAGGSITYEDGSPDGIVGDGIPDLDLPGWESVQSGNDILANGVDGSTGMNLFAAWGGDGRIQSAEPLGTIKGGETITITVMVGGPDAGPISGPLAFHLMADGVQLVPSSATDPTLPSAEPFQMISRTYDAAALADHIGASVKIMLGVEDENDLPNRVIFDNVTIDGLVETPILPLDFQITTSSSDSSLYTFSWNSKNDRLYDLVSQTDLAIPAENWPIWQGQADIAGTGEMIILSEIESADPKRFFALVEKSPE